MEWNGMEWNGMEWNRTEQNIIKCQESAIMTKIRSATPVVSFSSKRTERQLMSSTRKPTTRTSKSN